MTATQPQAVLRSPSWTREGLNLWYGNISNPCPAFPYKLEGPTIAAPQLNSLNSMIGNVKFEAMLFNCPVVGTVRYGPVKSPRRRNYREYSFRRNEARKGGNRRNPPDIKVEERVLETTSNLMCITEKNYQEKRNIPAF